MTTIGQRRFRVAIQEPVETRNADGGVVRTFNTVATVWADVRPLAGRELEAAGQMTGARPVKINIRSYSGLSIRNRIVLLE